uniref:NADH-ubiquinone oxidoreductase chain 4 n=1 Tax=Diplodiscus japonicus TaxID=1895467 RepID=A0A977WKW9_9TREM|nr:NADH dehydrogenase subunit 4 [Diplodiscus japonicus]UXL86279.1 NADH dehydrogenase subunit 4 [Diplodiscus japonicus]
MSYKQFDWYSCLVVCVFSSMLLVVFGVLSSFHMNALRNGLWSGALFSFDTVSLYLVLLSVFLWLSLTFLFGRVSVISKVFVTLSVISSLVCYCSVHCLVFWVFYELSILFLLLLLLTESPYSERYLASWYLLGYVVLTSLPMLLCLFYLSVETGSFDMRTWFSLCGDNMILGSGVLLVLGVMFVTKVPLPPFHVWLPIVHAEASSIVSVCLSGYIMKLGLLGVCRMCCSVLPGSLFSSVYMLVCMALAVLFFFSAARELDGKRWLAFLSLSHIVVAAICLSVVSFSGSNLAFIFSVGHGLSAGVVFILLWLVYEVSGSRNWFVLKFCLSGSLLMRCLMASGVCTVASLPPTLQFFTEVSVVSESGYVSLLFVYVFFLYLFFSGLVPLFLIGGLLSRHFSVSFGDAGVYGYFSSVLFLVLWSFIMFVIV